MAKQQYISPAEPSIYDEGRATVVSINVQGLAARLDGEGLVLSLEMPAIPLPQSVFDQVREVLMKGGLTHHEADVASDDAFATLQSAMVCAILKRRVVY